MGPIYGPETLVTNQEKTTLGINQNVITTEVGLFGNDEFLQCHCILHPKKKKKNLCAKSVSL
jgi:hypothetical protein